MSTKTSFKRIALVAASALALGGFSVISAPQANAAPGDVTSFVVSSATKVNGVALTASNYTKSTILHANGISSFNVAPGDTVTLVYQTVSGTSAGTNDSITVVMRGLANLSLNDTTTAAAAFQSANAYPGGAAANGAFAATTTPGSYPLDITYTRISSGVATVSVTTSVTMVVVAPTGFSSQLSTSFVNATGVFSGTEDAEVRVTKAITTAAASIQVTLKNTSGGAYVGGGTLDVQVISGPGLVDAQADGAGAVTATVRADTQAIASGVSAARVSVTADGTSGKSVIRIRLLDASTGASLGTIAEESVYFFGTVASLVATSVFSVAKASSTAIGCVSATLCPQVSVATTPFTTIKATDSEGNLVPGLTVSAVIADSTIIGSSTVVAVAQATLSAAAAATAGVTTDVNGYGYYNADVAGSSGAASGKSTTITYRTLLSGTTYVTAAPITVTIGGAIATETLSLNSTSYEPGDAMVVSRMAKDASGNTPYDGQTAGDVTFNKPVSGTVGASWYVGGKKVTSATAPSVYAPSASGAFLAKMTSAADGVTILTANAEVAGDQSSALALDAANAATDAANNAYDEAQNATQAASDALAAVTALAAQVESLIASVMAQVESLTASVKKLTAAVAKQNKKKM